MKASFPIVKKNFLIFVGIYVLLFFFLYQLWYKNQLTANFHFFNDATEWLGMDKCGHFFVSYLETWLLLTFYKLSEQKPLLFSAFFGFFCQFPIEIFDGFSIGYGFSVFDLLANFAGASFAYFQFIFWKRQIIIPQFSFLPTEFAAQRPELLGFTLISQIIKDYNGQIYWLSFNPNEMINRKIFPEWFLVSVGYGATEMLSGHAKNDENDTRNANIYLSIDVNWMYFNPKNYVLKFVLSLLCHIKIPLFMKL